MLIASSIAGFLAVSLGAFGTHVLKVPLESANLMETWRTAVIYHLVHSVALLAISLVGARFRRTAFFWMGGLVLFSGSLYALCLTGQKWLGAITPSGGLLLMAGWIAVAFPGREQP